MNANDITGFHVELTNACTLKCPGCARTQFIGSWPQHWKNNYLDLESLKNFIDIDLKDKEIDLCGVYGDAIYHPDFFAFIEYIKENDAYFVLSTNGSYKSSDWWHKLASLVDNKDWVNFGIDGTPGNFNQYRVNADWHSIKTGMEIMARSKSTVNWDFIPFAYNVHTIAEAKQISEQIGVTNFRVRPSDRYDDTTEYLQPIELKYTNVRSQKRMLPQKLVDPECENNKHHYISADGFYSPCCMVADHRFYYKTIFGKNKKNYNIKEHTISQLLDHTDVKEFYRERPKHTVCQFNCPGCA